MRLYEFKVEDTLSDSSFRFILNALKSKHDNRAINKITAMWKQGDRALFKYNKTLSDMGHDDLQSLMKKGVS